MKLIMRVQFGSKLYGTSTPESDTDYKGIYIPESRDILLGNVKKNILHNTASDEVKNTAQDIDEEYFSLQAFLEMAFKGETIAIDMLHAPENMVELDPTYGHIWTLIQSRRHLFYTTSMKAYLGYVKRQAAKYGIKGSRLGALRAVKDWAVTLPETKPVPSNEEIAVARTRVKNVTFHDGVMHQDTLIGDFFDLAPIDPEYAFMDAVNEGLYFKVLGSAYQSTLSVKRFKQAVNRKWNDYGERARQAERNEGIDWKSLHHAIRGGLQLEDIYTKGDIVYPLPYADYLLQIKQGIIPFTDVQEHLDTLVEKVDHLAKKRALDGWRDKVDTDYWYGLIEHVYAKEVSEYFLTQLAENQNEFKV